jgi:hypothetical protein
MKHNYYGTIPKASKSAVKQSQSLHKRDLAHSQYSSCLLFSHSQKALPTRRSSKSAQAQKGTRLMELDLEQFLQLENGIPISGCSKGFQLFLKKTMGEF